MNGSSGVLVTTVSAIDEDIDENGIIRYLLLGLGVEHFSINSSTGEIRVSSLGIDFEMVTSSPITLTLIAEDNGELIPTTIIKQGCI